MNYEIAIPSYDRPETLLKKTLPYLLDEAKVKARVLVFVADKKQLDLYRRFGIHKVVKLIVGVPTLMKQRRFISNYYKPGTRLFNIEDDIPGIVYSPDGKKLVTVTDLNSLIETGFNICASNKTRIWGVSPSHNPYFIVGKGVSNDLRILSGSAYGTINDHDKNLWTTLPLKEDYQRTINYFLRFGSVIRFNGYAVMNNPYNEKGGLNSFRNPEKIRECCEWLIKKYPNLVRVSPTRKQEKWMEIQLIKNPK